MGSFDVYWYEKNMQGDITAVYNSYGTKLVSYAYDAYGNFTRTLHGISSTHVAAKNPFTYRGYYYDYDLELYYVASRYYDPDTGRWLSADSLMSNAGGDVRGYNLFAYCFNNPVMYTDHTGNWPEWFTAFGNWVQDTFGAGVVQAVEYDTLSVDTLFFGTEYGVSSHKLVCGDVSKPISVYAVNASTPWRFWEYKAGIQININQGGVALSYGVGEASIILSANNESIEFVAGVNKYGVTHSKGVDFGIRTAEVYEHYYIRTVPTAGAVASIYLTYGIAIAPIVELAYAR